MGDAVRSLVLDVYDTVVDPGLWPGILDRIAASVGARGCMIFELEGEAPRQLRATWFSSRYDPALIRAYIDGYGELELADQDTFARHSLATDGIDLIDDSVLAESHEALLMRPNARQMAAWGVHHRAGALLNKDQPARDRFSVQFSARHGPFGPADQGTLREILPHVAKALDLARPVAQLARKSRALFDALDRFRVGVCLLTADRSVVLENAEFRRQRETCGVFALAPDGRLRLRAPEAQARLSLLLADAGDHGRHGARPRKEAIAARRGDGRETALAVEATPLTRADAFGEPHLEGYLLFSYDTGEPIALDVATVGRVLHLTPTEASLVALLAEGLTNAEIALRRERSVETINAHVKAMFAKADCANRTQFMRLATNIGADFVGP